MRKSISYLFMIITIVVCLSVGLIMFNLNSKKELSENKTTTTKKIEDFENVRKDKILIDDNYEEIMLKTYIAYGIFKIDVDVSNFEMVKMSNDTYYLKYLNDENIYMKFEIIDEYEYNQEIVFEGEDITLLHGDNIYLKVSKFISDDEKNISTRMSYMLSTIYIN